MIKISHEMPLYMMKGGQERTFNDYAYALVHLFENVSYYNYFVEVLKEGREVYLDNSIFELGSAFDAGKFVYWLRRLSSESGSTNIVYIIPDVLDNTLETISNARSFTSTYKNLPGKSMCVMQGETTQGLLDCYKVFKELNIDIYGVSFNCKAYEKLGFNSQNKLEEWKKARQEFIRFLYQYDPYRKPKSLHLLGCALPDEFKYYTITYPELSSFIVSIDTSNPIVHGLLDIKYDEEYGLKIKESIKLCDLLTIDIPKLTTQSIIKYNIETFRSINNL